MVLCCFCSRDLLKPGTSVGSRNARVDMVSFADDKCGFSEPAANFTVKEDNKMSLVE